MLPAAGTASASATLATAGHTSLHNVGADEARALATKIGTGSSTPVDNAFFVGNGVGTSSWEQAATARGSLGLGSVENYSAVQLLALAYPVGSIYVNAAVATNPATLLGFGTWTAFGQGRVMVGLNGSDADFDTAEETGGAKTHTLSTSEIPSHNHTVPLYGTGVGGVNPSTGPGGPTGIEYPTSSTGGGGSHNNLQPYVVVYMWKRVS